MLKERLVSDPIAISIFEPPTIYLEDQSVATLL